MDDRAIIDQVDLFLQQIIPSAQISVPVDITKRSKYLGLNIAGLLEFGLNLALQANEESSFMFHMLYSGSVWSSIGPIPAGSDLNWPACEFFDKNAQRNLHSVLTDALDPKHGGLRQNELWTEENLYPIVSESLPPDPAIFLIESMCTK
ncbi:hypothetical protein F4814DRAFT_448491 [Daldinia grandis]|nr:hypothetical protein F4814DRAFT_448491 [Daldinia grandis]